MNNQYARTYLFPAIIKDGDSTSLNLSLPFPPGSDNGTEMCAFVIILPDDKVGSGESVVVTLDLETDGDSFTLGNDETSIFITGITTEQFISVPPLSYLN